MVSCLFHRMSDFQAYDPTPDRWKENQTGHLSPLHAQKSPGSRLQTGGNREPCARINVLHEDWRRPWISLVCSLARAFVAIVKSQSETSHSEREFYKIRRVFKAPKSLREEKRLNAKNGTNLQLL